MNPVLPRHPSDAELFDREAQKRTKEAMKMSHEPNPLRVIPDPGRAYAGKVAPGDMWPIPDRDQPDRECWAIVLPNSTVWRTTDTANRSGGTRWEVTGEPPTITVSPSIWDQSPENGWHGWIKDGMLVSV